MWHVGGAHCQKGLHTLGCKSLRVLRVLSGSDCQELKWDVIAEACACAVQIKKLIKEIQGRKKYRLDMAELRAKSSRIGDFTH